MTKRTAFFPKRLMFGKTLFPFLDAKLEIIVIFLGEDGAFSVLQFRAAGGVGQDWVFHDVLVNGFDERIIGNRLDKNRAVVMARRGGNIHLQGRGDGLFAASDCECPEWI